MRLGLSVNRKARFQKNIVPFVLIRKAQRNPQLQ